MKWSSKTVEQTNKEKKTWHRWYAWFPVRLSRDVLENSSNRHDRDQWYEDTDQVVWLEYVERKKSLHWNWIYRACVSRLRNDNLEQGESL